MSQHSNMWGNLFFKLSLAEIVEFGIRDSIWGTFAWFRKHLINIGAEADFIKIFVLNSHKDKGGKKTASRSTRLPRLFIMIRLSKVRRICCYKTIFSYISFTFCHGFAVVSCNSGRNLWVYICLFHHANQVRFWCRSSESRYKRHRITLQKYENCWKLANYTC